MTSPVDYSPITETPGIRLSRDQIARLAHRYRTGADLAHGRRVLEIACGAGCRLGSLQQAARWLAGLDATQALLHQVRAQYGPELPLACGDGQQLPYANGSLDLVLWFEAIYYMPGYLAFLREALRVLAPHGLLLIGYSTPDWPDFVAGEMSVHYPSGPEMAQALEAAGFSNICFEGILPAGKQGIKRKGINRVRRYVARTHLLPRTGALADRLKQIGYGKLVALPPVLTLESLAPYAVELTPQALIPSQIDRTHRVLYAYGEKPG